MCTTTGNKREEEAECPCGLRAMREGDAKDVQGGMRSMGEEERKKGYDTAGSRVVRRHLTTSSTRRCSTQARPGTSRHSHTWPT